MLRGTGSGGIIQLSVSLHTSAREIMEYIAVSVGAGRGAVVEVVTRGAENSELEFCCALVRTRTRCLT